MRKSVLSIIKAGMILEAFTPEEPSLTASGVARRTGLPLTTVHRLLTSLVCIRLLDKDVDAGVYTISRHAYLCGNLYLRGHRLDYAAQPVVKRVNAITSESVNLGVLESGFLVLIMKEESTHRIRFATHVGSILPAHASSMGKALLAELNEDELKSQLPETLSAATNWTTTSWTQLRQELEDVRRTGFAIDNEGVCDGVRCVGAAIRDAEGRPIAALSVAVPTLRLTTATWNGLKVIVPLAARIISARLGYEDATCSKTLDDLQQLWATAHTSEAIS